eukprot:TRINITY_DN30791_c0_g1_i1.p1 TRINITY_DN30791_c0_g1~~TRINITY_DN30791_c0_g1_i1.p1  ORF type:complete len:352 (+),score=58.92 TRINITY_DN30791_c0_g1_i1:59-1114(+)
MRALRLRALPLGRRGVVIGASFDEDPTNLRGVPRHAESNVRRRDFREGRTSRPARAYDEQEPEGFGDSTVGYEHAADATSSRSHRRETQRMASASGLPEPRVSARGSVPDPTKYMPGKNTRIVLRQLKQELVLGVNMDGTTLPVGGRRRKLENKPVLHMYRAFWRLLQRYPAEARPRLARLLRRAFKKNVYMRRKTDISAAMKLGKQVLKRFVDFIARRERLRVSHDPVERFLVLHAEEQEKWIDSLDFYPYTNSPTEHKPIHDIGFHMIMKPGMNPGTPKSPPPYAGLRQTLNTRQRVRIRQTFLGSGPALRSMGNSFKLTTALKRHRGGNRKGPWRVRAWREEFLDMQR